MTQPRYVKLDGIQRTVMGNKILDTYEISNSGVQEIKDLLISVQTKIKNESWEQDRSAPLVSLEVYMVGFRNMTASEVAAVTEYDKSQSDEYQKFLKLKEKYEPN